ncbi:MAG: putative DNA binding protein [Halobacteriales archaeon]|jgi:predicted DNA binding protein
MTRASLTISIPAEMWIGRISRSYPNAELTILSAFPGEKTATGLVEISGPDVTGVIEAFQEEETVTALDVLNRSEDASMIQIETTEPTLLFPIVGSGIPLEMPFPIQDGEAHWIVTCSHDRLSELGDQLDAVGISYTLHTLEHDHASEDLLTEDQQALIETAIQEGYYDVPRSCTLTDLAEAVDIAKSTCSEKLHRAESKIVREYATGAETEADEHWQQGILSLDSCD